MNILRKNKRISASIIAAVIALTPVAMLAEGHNDHGDGYREADVVIRSMEQHQITLPQIIKTAEKAGEGIAIGVEVEDDSAIQTIEVTLLRDNEVLCVNLSPLTGDVVKIGSPEIIHSAVARLTNRYDSLKDNKVSLQEAVSIAEKAEQGTAYHAHIEDMDDWDGYEISIVSNGTHLRVIVDPETGRIVSRETRNNRHHKDH